jgi:hypothetical protein
MLSAVEQRLRATAKYRESKYSVDVSGLVERSEQAQEVVEIARLGEHWRTRERATFFPLPRALAEQEISPPPK